MSSDDSKSKIEATAQPSMQVDTRPSWDAKFTAVFTRYKSVSNLFANVPFARGPASKIESSPPPNVAIKPYQIRVTKKNLLGVLKKSAEQEDGTRTLHGDWLSMVEEEKPQKPIYPNTSESTEQNKEGNMDKTKNQKKIILYLHGGGYIGTSAKSHRSVTGNIVKNSGYEVLSLNYRLAPENPFPSALLDAVYSYLHLINTENGLGYKPNNVFIAGDSAGGGLAIATCCYLRDYRYPMPGAIIALSPWVTPVEKEKRANKYDYLDVDDYSNNPIQHYLGNYPVDHPYITITNASLVRLPPMLVQFGEVESLRVQIESFISKYKKSNNFVRAEIYKDMPHVFQLFDFHSTAQQAFKNIGQFLADLQSGVIKNNASRRRIDHRLLLNMKL